MRWLIDAPRDFVRGFAYVPRGLRFLRVHAELRRLAYLPAALTAALLVAIPWLALSQRVELARRLWSASASDGVLTGFAHGLLGFVLGLLLLAAGLLVAAALATALASPINDYLSERVEERATGLPAQPFRLGHALREAGRVIKLSAVRALIYLVLMTSSWLLAWLVPGVGHVLQLAIAVPLTLAYLSLDQVDFAAARRGWSVARRLGLLREHPALLLGFGSGVWLCLCIPLVNVLFMPVSVTGGTLLVIDLQGEPPSA